MCKFSSHITVKTHKNKLCMSPECIHVSTDMLFIMVSLILLSSLKTELHKVLPQDTIKNNKNYWCNEMWELPLWIHINKGILLSKPHTTD
jgi:hypothetical protein